MVHLNSLSASEVDRFSFPFTFVDARTAVSLLVEEILRDPALSLIRVDNYFVHVDVGSSLPVSSLSRPRLRSPIHESGLPADIDGHIEDAELMDEDARSLGVKFSIIKRDRDISPRILLLIIFLMVTNWKKEYALICICGGDIKALSLVVLVLPILVCVCEMGVWWGLSYSVPSWPCRCSIKRGGDRIYNIHTWKESKYGGNPWATTSLFEHAPPILSHHFFVLTIILAHSIITR